MAKVCEAGSASLQVEAQSRLHGEQSLKFLFATVLLVAAIGVQGAACLIDAVTDRKHSVAVGTSISEDGSKLEWDGTVARTAGQKSPPLSGTNPSIKITWTKDPNAVGYLIQQRDGDYHHSPALCTKQRRGLSEHPNRNNCIPALGPDRNYAVVPNYMTAGMNWWVYAIQPGYTHVDCEEQRQGLDVLPACKFIGGVSVRCGEASSRSLSAEYSSDSRDVEDYELVQLPYPRGTWANTPTWNPAYQRILNERHGTNHDLCYSDGIGYEKCRCAVYSECGVSDPDPPDPIQPDPDPPPPPEEEDPKDPDPPDPPAPEEPEDQDPPDESNDPDPKDGEPDDPQEPESPSDPEPQPEELEPNDTVSSVNVNDAVLYFLLEQLEE